MKMIEADKWGGILLYLINDAKLERDQKIELARGIMIDLDKIANAVNHCRFAEDGGLLDSLSGYMLHTQEAFASLPEDKREGFSEELQRFEGSSGYSGGLWSAIEEGLAEMCGCRAGQGVWVEGEPKAKAMEPIVGETLTLYPELGTIFDKYTRPKIEEN